MNLIESTSKSNTLESQGPLESLFGGFTHLLREDYRSDGVDCNRVVEVLVEDEPFVGEVSPARLHQGLVDRLQVLQAALVGHIVLGGGESIIKLDLNS